MPNITDAQQRTAALDPGRSFIVQAPAGSGKTELLIQRYLKLLALVEQPEEIIAITFTRKAAAEMRQRVMQALLDAQQACPEEPHKQTTWHLATQALQQAGQQQWELFNSPQRLRIQTFDSLATNLSQQMPLLADLGAPPGIQENAFALYRQAAHNTLANLNDPELGTHLARVLRHLGNQIGQLENLLSRLLAKRDQWLPHILYAPQAGQLAAALNAEIEQRLQTLTKQASNLVSHLLPSLHYAAKHVAADHLLKVWHEQTRLPSYQREDLKLWQAIAELLLTKDGNLRKSIGKSIGFPAPSEKGINKEEKAQRKQAKDELSQVMQAFAEDTALLAALDETRILPTASYSATQSELLESLMQVLLQAAVQLQLVFQEQSAVDFAEIQQRAIQALGSEDQPTDLALSLDYRIQHLLVDEFQDTSSSQHRLLRLITAGWQNNDGHSLFLVGDPMQSIYRFREAEVGLYLKTREQGLGQLKLQALTLQMNFRSQAGLVDWVNASFQQIFPQQFDVARSAVNYSASQAAHLATINPAVQWHLQAERDDIEEAEQICQLIQQQTNDVSIAILARSRSHVAQIAQSMQQANIAYQAIDIDPLTERTVIQDLRTLTRALLHPADRLAWLALLRAPWLGLGIEDLLALAEGHAQNIYQRLQATNLPVILSPDGYARITRLMNILQPALPYRGKLALRSYIKGIWLALGGLAIAGEQNQADAEAYFALLDELTQNGQFLDFAELDEKLAALYAAPDTQADSRIQIMTMHAAKGLEFDLVILPGLGKKPPADENELLYWQERTQEPALLMAPIRAANATAEPISDFLRHLDKEKNTYESMRLLYVAATRARQQLHLFGHCGSNQQQTYPAKNSLLEQLWPIAEIGIKGSANLISNSPSSKVEEIKLADPLIPSEQRLAANWQLGFADNPITDQTNTQETSNPIDFQWAGDTARHVGTLVHRYLERIANEGLSNWPIDNIQQHQPYIQTALLHLGVEPDKLEPATAKTIRAIQQTLEDDTGRWILEQHQEAACELALTILDEEQQAHHYIIDRTFIDDKGTRWIIDYKTGDHLDDDIESFLDNEQQRYQDQLNNYGYILSLQENRPCKLALYFPLLKDWRVWDYLSTTVN
jgi:ATP-dependent helicase/nuclease subunit A